MKKILGILMIGLMLIFTANQAEAQTKVGSNPLEVAGTAADTLTASVTKSYVIDFTKFAGKDAGAQIMLWTDLVSGTATFGWKYWWSQDGTNFTPTAADSTTAAKSHASDFVNLFYIDSLTARYLKLSIIATSATQKSTIYVKANGYYK